MSEVVSTEPAVVAPHNDGDAPEEPLTKARLFTSTSDDGSWTEMGIGVVSIVVEAVGGGTVTIAGETDTVTAEEEASGYSSSAHSGGGGKRGMAESARGSARRMGKLVMVALDDAEDVLVSTPLSLEDIYLVQNDTILVWSDPQLGRDMACSFNTKEGCDVVLHDIYEYQRTERLGMVSSLQDERLRQSNERWAIRRENLPFILEAVTTNTHRFGIFVRDHDNYFSELVDLFTSAQKEADTPTMEAVSQVTLSLLKSPYSTEGKIIGQFVESRVIEKCIDIVQFGIGRRDAATGFVSFEQRRATFRNPCKLPPSFLPRIHVLYACSYLKDLLPLSLEDGDASSNSLLTMFLTQFKLRLMEDICDSPTILPNAFRDAAENGPAAFELAAFVNDMAKTVKNALVVISTKEHIFDLIAQAGVIGFLHRTIQLALEAYTLPPAADRSGAGAPSHAVSPGRAVQLVCDILTHMLSMLPSLRDILAAAATNDPAKCLLLQLMRAMTVVETSAELQAVGDVLVACVVDAIPGLASSYGAGLDSYAQRRRDILHFWINGNSIDKPPLFLLASSIAARLPTPQTAAPRPDGSASSEAAVMQAPLSVSAELRVVYGLRVFARLVEEAAGMDLLNGLAGLIGLSGLLAGLREALVQKRQRRWANVQSSVVAFIASLIKTDDDALMQALCGEDRLLEACMELFLAQCRRDNILSSSAAHVFVALCERVHREKRALTETAQRPPIAAGPYASFVRGEDSLSATPHASAPPHTGQDTIAALVDHYGSQLRAEAPTLAERLDHALTETPEEAQQADAESSSVASTIERSAFSGLAEYDALAIEFGVEPGHLGQSPPMEATDMEEQLSVLSRELSEDPLHLDDDEEDEDEENDEGGDSEEHEGPRAPASAEVVPPTEEATPPEQGNLRNETLSPAPAPAGEEQAEPAAHEDAQREMKRPRDEASGEAEANADVGAAPRSKPRTESDSVSAAGSPEAPAS